MVHRVRRAVSPALCIISDRSMFNDWLGVAALRAWIIDAPAVVFTWCPRSTVFPPSNFASLTQACAAAIKGIKAAQHAGNGVAK